MATYESFAEVYDLFMDNVPYDVWKTHLLDILGQYHITDGLVAELGCGTGKMTRRLAEAGYDMIGIDNSYDMLSIAMEHPAEDILYLCQDMRAFELYGTVAAVISVCDSMNYLTSRSDMELTIKAVHSQLRDGGIFIFDMKTASFYKDELGNNVFADRAGRVSYVWQNHYDEKTHINTYDITFYRRIFANICLSCREKHRQRAYSVKQIKDIAAKCGMELLEHTVRGERAYYILKKQAIVKRSV